jgi:hypothetical protein
MDVMTHGVRPEGDGRHRAPSTLLTQSPPATRTTADGPVELCGRPRGSKEGGGVASFLPARCRNRSKRTRTHKAESSGWCRRGPGLHSRLHPGPSSIDFAQVRVKGTRP